VYESKGGQGFAKETVLDVRYEREEGRGKKEAFLWKKGNKRGGKEEKSRLPYQRSYEGWKEGRSKL